MRQSRFAHILTAFVLLSAALAPVRPAASSSAPRLQPQLAQIAAQAPQQTVRVIVQKSGQGAGLESLVARLGGRVTRDLHIINAFAAELTAAAARQVAAAPGVRWVSLDSPMVSTQTTDTSTFTAWATDLGTAGGSNNALGADFNGTAIAAGQTLWFSSVIKPSGLPNASVTVRFFDAKIRLVANGQVYEIPVPEGQIQYSPSATAASVTYDPGVGLWLTTVPSNYTAEAFLAGVAWTVPVPLPGGIKDVTWSGRFAVDTPGVDIDWKWAAAVYAASLDNYQALGVKPINGDKLNPYRNSDKAGTPEAAKTWVVKGARGDGGSNYTGNFCPSTNAVLAFNSAEALIDSAIGPNGVYAGGSEVFQSVTGFVPEITPGHAIVKVEAILPLYVAAPLSHDIKLRVYAGGQADYTTIRHDALASYVGAANAQSLAVDLTGLRTWQWGDFANGLELAIDQLSLSAGEMVYYDALGLRVTTAPGYDATNPFADDPPAAEATIDGSQQANVFNAVIGADRLWNEPDRLRGQGVTVAVVDSGVFKTGDVNGHHMVSVNFSRGYHDSTDRFGHGTFVTGLIAGTGEKSHGQNIGVAPKARILNVRVSDDIGQANESDVVAGLQWIVENKDRFKIRVVNLSLNAAEPQSYDVSPLDAAAEILWFNGIVVVVSAGNNGSAMLLPPANDPFVITVGATDDRGTIALDDDSVASFSAYGVTEAGTVKPELVAPGRNIVAFLPGNRDLTIGREHAANRVNDNYFRMSGTSMAAPMVTGAVGLLLQDEPGLTPDQVKYRLLATANKSWPGYDPARAGAGYLDAYAAVHGSTTESANSGLSVSHLLTTGPDGLTDASVSWSSVSWSSVSWSSVSWSSVSWSSVSWSSDYWGP